MKSFKNYLQEKPLEAVADYCVENNIPIIPFFEWCEEEGILLEFDPFTLGTLAAGAGAYGLAKAGWNKFSNWYNSKYNKQYQQFSQTKDQIMKLLGNLRYQTGTQGQKQIDGIIQQLDNMQRQTDSQARTNQTNQNTQSNAFGANQNNAKSTGAFGANTQPGTPAQNQQLAGPPAGGFAKFTSNMKKMKKK